MERLSLCIPRVAADGCGCGPQAPILSQRKQAAALLPAYVTCNICHCICSRGKGKHTHESLQERGYIMCLGREEELHFCAGGRICAEAGKGIVPWDGLHKAQIWQNLFRTRKASQTAASQASDRESRRVKMRPSILLTLQAPQQRCTRRVALGKQQLGKMDLIVSAPSCRGLAFCSDIRLAVVGVG